MSIIATPVATQTAIARRAKARRLTLQLTQEGLAARSGVSLGSLKIFERTGRISLESLLKLAVVLEALQDFEAIFKEHPTPYTSLDQLLDTAAPRRRGRIK